MLRKLRLRQKNDFLIKKTYILKSEGANTELCGTPSYRSSQELI